MNADNMVKAGNGMFAAGCGFMLVVWVLIPMLIVFGFLIFSSAGVWE
jgi:hypothetical protein